MKRLKTLRIGGKTYYIDERLNQIRNVKNPHDYEDVSPELIRFWTEHCEQKRDLLVCDLKRVKKI
jgi:hypothetical protein